MKTYNFVEKNGNAVITLSADNETEAENYLEEIIKYPKEWRLEIGEDDL